MAHFAEINNENQVLRVIVVGDNDCKDQNGQESEEIGIQFCKSLLGEETNWKQTSYNKNIRKNYAAVGYFYDEAKDAFIPPRPFESWILNENTCLWEPPVAIPSQEEGKFIPYVWSEEKQNWINLENKVDS